MRYALGLMLLAVAACGGSDDWQGGGDNEIVFGLEKSGDSLDASYEYIDLDNQGGSTSVPVLLRDRTGECFIEDTSNRLGHPHVDNGVATWSGGALPAAGVQVLANQSADTVVTGAGWASTDTLSFTAEGFAMPVMGGIQLAAPLVELALADTTADLTALPSTSDLTVSWTPPAATSSSLVMAALMLENTEVRCFEPAASGQLAIPANLIATLYGTVPSGTAVTGRLKVTTHSQATVFGPSGWTMYAVATVVHRDVAFTGAR